MEIIDKLEAIKERWEALREQLNDPELMNDMKRYVKVNKDYKDLEPVIEAFNQYKTYLANINEAKEMLKTEKDEDMRAMAQEELDEATEKRLLTNLRGLTDKTVIIVTHRPAALSICDRVFRFTEDGIETVRGGARS